LNLSTQKLHQYELPYAPQFSFDNFKPVVDVERNIAIMPAYDDVVFKTDDSGETVFEFRIVLFDLTTFDIVCLLPVRDFKTDQLDCADYSCKAMADTFLAAEKNKNYNDALGEFYANLNTIKVVPDGIWLCWRGGILRKINSEYNLSPLLVTSSMPRSAEGMFASTYFHSDLYHIDKYIIVLSENSSFYKSPVPDLESTDSESPIALKLEQTSLDELYNLSYSPVKRSEIEERDNIKIEVTDLSTKESIIDALDQMQAVVSDLKAFGIGSILSFVIKDTKGKTLQEPQFFAEAVEYAPELMNAIVKKFINFSNAKYTYRNAEETALCFAVFELTKKGEHYLTTILEYLAVIDLDHDVFNLENVIPLIENTYSDAELRKKMEAVSKQLAEWYEYYQKEAQ
jgi:hypothetical protein